MPEYVSKGGVWVRKEQTIPSPPAPKKPVVVKDESVIEEKPVTKSKPKKKKKGR